MVKEIWEIIWEHPNYAVSTHGRIESFSRVVPTRNRWGATTRTIHGRILKPTTDGKYLVVHLGDPTVNYSVHRLVARTFLGEPLPGHIVNHKDGNKLNNLVTNLEWVTAQENTQHAYNNDLKKAAKLSASAVRDIRSRSIAGEHIKSIALDHGITGTYAAKVRDGHSWGWVE